MALYDSFCNTWREVGVQAAASLNAAMRRRLNGEPEPPRLPERFDFSKPPPGHYRDLQHPGYVRHGRTLCRRHGPLCGMGCLRGVLAMAQFTLKELNRRRARLQERLEYLQARAAEENRPGFSYIAQEASSLQTALVLFDEEIERTEAGGTASALEESREGPLRCGPWRVSQYGAVRISDGERGAIVFDSSGDQCWSVVAGSRGAAASLPEAMAIVDAELRARGYIVEGCVTYRAKRSKATP